MKILQYFKITLEAEYNNLNIWYFVSFIYGIIVYFSLDFELSFTTIFFIFCACLILTFTRNSNIFLQFTYWMIIAFIFGVFISKYRVTNLHGETLHKPIITEISGNIESIKPTIIGGQIVLNNIKIEKINRNLQKVKISIPKKYIYL